MKSWINVWFAAVLASSISFCSAYRSEHCNAFVEDVLSQLKQDKDFFQEPYEISEQNKPFGIYEVESGHVYGLNTLHRVSDVLPLKKNGSPYLKVYLGAGELKLRCKVKRRFLSFGKTANVEALLPFVEIELDVVPNPDGSDPVVKSFKVGEAKGLDVKVTGTGFVRDVILNVFVNTVGKFFKQLVRAGVEERLKSFLEEKVKNFKIPLECLNEAID